jgi:hypothetical protein
MFNEHEESLGSRNNATIFLFEAVLNETLVSLRIITEKCCTADGVLHNA